MTSPNEFTKCNRRTFLAATGGTLAGLTATSMFADQAPRRVVASTNRHGVVVTEREAAKVGMEVLASGGNAIDAAVAAALVAGVVNVSKCGIGGYGGHMMIGKPDGKVTAIDFNSTAPAAARAEMFPVDGKGIVKGNINKRGWLAAGVPGTLAGLQLALDRYGTMPFKRLVQPAIRHAREGFPLRRSYAFWVDPSHPSVPRDPASARLFSRNGKPLKAGDLFRNPALADMLQSLAESGAVDPFYRGLIGRRIAAAFKKNGGIVTAEDMASYHAVEVKPLSLEWRGYTIATAPLTAGGLTILQAMAALKSLGEGGLPKDGPTRTQAWLEALRVAWGDRLQFLGDPDHVDVPVARLLSEQYAQQTADKIKSAVAERRPVPVETDGRTAGGTVHVSAVDAGGMMASITLTHGESFGAQVTVDGLGLILGHGMSRFDPVPGRPNSVAPAKRPLDNMSPTIVSRDGRPVLAIGGTGGRRIPNGIFQVLLGVIGEGRTLEESVKVPRLHTEGGIDIHVEARVPEADIKYLKQIGYSIKKPLPVSVFAVEFDNTKGPSAAVHAGDSE